MLCSRCSEVVRPIVAVDIDGTLGDYHSHFLDFAGEYLGCHIGSEFSGTFFKAMADESSCFSETPFKDWFRTETLIEEATWKDLKLAYRQGARKRTMPVYPDAALLTDMIRSAGAELWLTTTRPYLRLDNVDPDTRVWLERAKIEYDGLLYDEDKYRKLAEMIDPDRVVAVIDDLPEQLRAAQTAFGFEEVAVLRRTMWNRGVSWDAIEGESLYPIGRLCLERINNWKEAHHA